MLKTWPLTIQPSTMTPLSTTVSRKCVGVKGWGGMGMRQWLQMHFTLTTRIHWYMRVFNNNGYEHNR